jgi:DNA invertase Pin-like site-specific DNA recombinase
VSGPRTGKHRARSRTRRGQLCLPWPATAAPTTGAQLGYARVSTGHQSLDQQLDALSAAGVNPKRVYSDKLSGTSTREQRPGLAALLDYARPGDAIVVIGIDRLGRNAAEVMTTIRELREREIISLAAMAASMAYMLAALAT